MCEGDSAMCYSAEIEADSTMTGGDKQISHCWGEPLQSWHHNVSCLCQRRERDKWLREASLLLLLDVRKTRGCPHHGHVTSRERQIHMFVPQLIETSGAINTSELFTVCWWGTESCSEGNTAESQRLEDSCRLNYSESQYIQFDCVCVCVCVPWEPSWASYHISLTLRFEM